MCFVLASPSSFRRRKPTQAPFHQRSRAQVLIHMVENEEKYSSLLEKAWAAAIVTPRVVGRRSAGGGGGSKRKRRWTEQPRVGHCIPCSRAVQSLCWS